MDVVAAVRRSGGKYRVNVATPGGIERHEISGVEIFNPKVAEDRKALIQAVAEAAEIATALPSVKFYGHGPGSGCRGYPGSRLEAEIGQQGPSAGGHLHRRESQPRGPRSWTTRWPRDRGSRVTVAFSRSIP